MQWILSILKSQETKTLELLSRNCPNIFSSGGGKVVKIALLLSFQKEKWQRDHKLQRVSYCNLVEIWFIISKTLHDRCLPFSSFFLKVFTQLKAKQLEQVAARIQCREQKPATPKFIKLSSAKGAIFSNYLFPLIPPISEFQFSGVIWKQTSFSLGQPWQGRKKICIWL